MSDSNQKSDLASFIELINERSSMVQLYQHEDVEKMLKGVLGQKEPRHEVLSSKGFGYHQQQILYAQKVGEGKVVVEVTKQMSGFLIGDNGAHIFAIMNHTDTKIQSGIRHQVEVQFEDGIQYMDTRIFVIEGEEDGIAKALDIMVAACERYVYLTEDESTKNEVEPEQKIRGIVFTYKPVPQRVNQNSTPTKKVPRTGSQMPKSWVPLKTYTNPYIYGNCLQVCPRCTQQYNPGTMYQQYVNYPQVSPELVTTYNDYSQYGNMPGLYAAEKSMTVPYWDFARESYMSTADQYPCTSAWLGVSSIHRSMSLPDGQTTYGTVYTSSGAFPCNAFSSPRTATTIERLSSISSQYIAENSIPPCMETVGNEPQFSHAPASHERYMSLPASLAMHDSIPAVHAMHQGAPASHALHARFSRVPASHAMFASVPASRVGVAPKYIQEGDIQSSKEYSADMNVFDSMFASNAMHVSAHASHAMVTCVPLLHGDIDPTWVQDTSVCPQVIVSECQNQLDYVKHNFHNDNHIDTYGQNDKVDDLGIEKHAPQQQPLTNCQHFCDENC